MIKVEGMAGGEISTVHLLDWGRLDPESALYSGRNPGTRR